MKDLVKILILLFAFINQGIKAENYPDGLSNGTLNINGKDVPVKIFATTNPATLDEFSEKDVKASTLIFLNEDMNKYASMLYPKFSSLGYQALDKKFLPTDDLNRYKYLYKPLQKEDEIVGGKVALHTPFFVWNPVKGIQLGGFMLHFYSLMFVLAFGLGFKVMEKMFKIDNVDAKYLEPLFILTIVGTILGARLGHVYFYEPELVKKDFWAVFLPIRTQPKFEFTGFSGLASHGATIALILTTLYYSFKVIKKNPLWVYDRLGIVVALGGTFVRIGNFINSEIIGKIASEDSPFAVLFPQMSEEYGATVPRYPSQLFEAVGYITLFAILWWLYNHTDKKYQQGWLFGFFFIVLWSIRFFVEFLKEPQGDEFITLGTLNTGQVLSIPFILIGVILMLVSKRFSLSNR